MDIIDYERIVDRIRSSLLAHTIMAPEYDRIAKSYFDRWTLNRTNEALFEKWLIAYTEAQKCHEIVRVLKNVLDEK